ncbi:MAG: cbb3-type cytochrome c oxidase subunit I [Nitrososphaeraceae archaeon]
MSKSEFYEKEESPIPKYEVKKEVSDLTIMFIVASIIYFLIAGSLALVMRLIQSNAFIFIDPEKTLGLFYASLTIHGQVMFFGFISMLTVGISYYLISKFGKKPLRSMNLAILSFCFLNSGVILLIIAGTMFFGAGWYNLMPLTFQPGNDGWNIHSAVIFLIGDVLIGIALVMFCINIIATVLSGKIAAGIQKTEQMSNISNNRVLENHEDIIKKEDKIRDDSLTVQYLPASTRWISVLGISSWFPRKYRLAIPAMSIVVVGIFVNAMVQFVGNFGLFTQLFTGFTFLLNPNFQPSWLFTKDAWWFFGHPIVYFTLFSFLGAAYYYIPRYAKKIISYDKWAYRSWPFYFIFTMTVFTHHAFMDMPNPEWLKFIAQTSSLAIVFPSGLTIMTIMMYIFRSKISWNLTSLFMLSGIAGWAFGGYTGTQTGWWGQDVYLHNTMNIVGHIHLTLLMGSVLFAMGLIYSIIPAITKVAFNKTLGIVHLLLTLIGGFGISFLFTYLGFAGFIRREAIMPEEFAWSMPLMLFFAIIVAIGQIIFAYNLMDTLNRKYKFISKNKTIFYVAIISTAIAGISHILIVSLFMGFESTPSIFLLLSGIIQVFWIVPLVKKWGKIWYIVGGIGTIFLIYLYISVQFDMKFIMFFLVIGLAQIFWIVPYLSTWNRKRLYIGISISSIIILAWLFTNAPEKIFGLNAPYDDISISLEIMQVVFIASIVVIIIKVKDDSLSIIFKKLRRQNV